MFYATLLLSIAAFISILVTPTAATYSIVRNVSVPQVFPINRGELLVEKSISMTNRHKTESINTVFRDNILLNIAYMSGQVTSKRDINWEEINKPFEYEFELQPGETFAFHEDVLPEYQNSLVKTSNSHFNAKDGYKSSGYLYGDGVCHLASLMYWAALDAGLHAYAPKNHDFRAIPDIDKKYGVSILYTPGQPAINAKKNLYITNNKTETVKFRFEYQDQVLKLKVSKSSNF